MTARDLVRTSRANLGRHKVRTFLTVFGVFVGILALVSMVSVGVGIQRELVRSAQAVGLETITVRPKYQEPENPYDPFAERRAETPLTPDMVARLEKLPGVESIRPGLWLPSHLDLRLRIGDEWGPAYLFGRMDPGPFQTRPKLLHGRTLTPQDREGVVLSTGLLETMGFQPRNYRDLVGQELAFVAQLPQGETVEFPARILGVVDYGERGILLGIEEVLRVKEWWYGKEDLLETEGYDQVEVKATTLADVKQLASEIGKLGFQVQSMQLVVDMANKIFAVVNTLLGSVGALALFVASLGVANTMIMAVYERTREIGILKALGASPGDILRLFTIEASLIGFLGGIAGIIFGGLLAKLVDWGAHIYLQRTQEVTIQGHMSAMPWWLALGAVLFATLVGLVAGLYPAARAARLDPVRALRYE